jgi:hypothetical protein
VLESLGWRICRIWSTDWLRDRRGQLRRLMTALEQAQREGLSPRREATTVPSLMQSQEALPTDELSPPTSPLPLPARLGYESIEEVPDSDLHEAILEALRTYGATAAEDLFQAVARQLGFRRTGRRIQERIEEAIEKLARAGKICYAADQRLQLVGNARAASS